MDETEINKNRDLLWDYLTYNIVPTPEKRERMAWLRWFTMYWRNEIPFEKLDKVCPVTTGELKRRFDVFLKSEDLE